MISPATMMHSRMQIRGVSVIGISIIVMQNSAIIADIEITFELVESGLAGYEIFASMPLCGKRVA